MNSSSYESVNREAASSHAAGGCFSLFFSPWMSLLLVLSFFLLAAGKTTLASDLNQGITSPSLKQSEKYQRDNDAVTTNNEQNIAPLFTPEVQYWSGPIVKWAAKHDLDPNLAATVMQIESCGDPYAQSHAGAMGLFQVMPFHFQEGESPFLPAINAERGLAYLHQSMDQLGSVRLALAGYNGGINMAAQDENNWPDETVRYVYWGMNIYKDASKGRSSSKVLDEWLSHGGASLCAQAHLSLAQIH